LDARHEHLGRPARAAQHRGRAHLALHRDGGAVRVDRIEVDVGMRVDEVEARQRAFDVDFARRSEAADAVMRRDGPGQHEADEGHDDAMRCGRHWRVLGPAPACDLYVDWPLMQRSARHWLAAAALSLASAHAATAQQESFATVVPAPRSDENSRVAHEALVRKAGSGVIDVYFIGDSITRRWGAVDYPELLANFNSNFFGWNAANFGWGGDRTQNM